MSPAKVIFENKTFFIDSRKEIHQFPVYDGLSLEDRKRLAFLLIIGNENGFIVRSDKREDRNVAENCPALILPMGTRIEPITSLQMENEIKFQQRPCLKEK